VIVSSKHEFLFSGQYLLPSKMTQQASSTVPNAVGREVEHVIVFDAEHMTTVRDYDDETHKGHPQPRARVTLVQCAAVAACVLLAVWFAEEIADAFTMARRPIVNWKQRSLGLMGPIPPEYSTTGAEDELAIMNALVTAQIQIAEAELAATAPTAAGQTNLEIDAETRAVDAEAAAMSAAMVVAMMAEGGNDDLDDEKMAMDAAVFHG